jgi:hypothetical protein
MGNAESRVIIFKILSCHFRKVTERNRQEDQNMRLILHPDAFLLLALPLFGNSSKFSVFLKLQVFPHARIRA